VAAAGNSDNTWACSVGASQCNGAEAKQWVNNQEYCCFGTDSIDVEVMNNKVQCTCGDGESAEEPHSNTTAVSAPTVPNLVDICYRYTNDVVGSNVHVIGSGGPECYAMWLNYTLAIHSGAGHDMTDMVRVISIITRAHIGVSRATSANDVASRELSVIDAVLARKCSGFPRVLPVLTATPA
jgi:hypothetical protein